MRIEKSIKKLFFFSLFREKQTQILSNYLEFETFSAGETLLQQGKKGNKLLIVKSGSASISVLKPGGKKRHITNTQIGNSYGEVSMITGYIITASLCALERMECYTFKREQLVVLRGSQPELAIEIENVIARSAVKKIKNMIKLIVCKLAGDIYQKHKLSKTAKSFNTLKPFDLIHYEEYEILAQDIEYQHLMKRIPLFTNFEDEELKEMFKYCHIISYRKGAVVCSGEQHSIDIVCSGILQLFNDILPKISFIEPGLFYGQISYYDKNMNIDAFCREDTILIRFPLDQLAMMRKNDFTIWKKFHAILCSQVVKLLYDFDRLILRIESEG